MPIRYCSATSKRTKKPCRARAMIGREVCYHHGGKTPRGRVSPHYKHGYYSKCLFEIVWWNMLHRRYAQARRQERLEALIEQLRGKHQGLSKRTRQRYMAEGRAIMRTWPKNERIPPELAQAYYDYFQARPEEKYPY